MPDRDPTALPATVPAGALAGTTSASLPDSLRYEGLDAFRVVGVLGVVFVHVYLALGKGWLSPSVDLLLRLRACALPGVILTSFFVVTRSLLAHPDQRFAQLFARRFWRLEVPCLLWTAIYWILRDDVPQLLAGRFPPPPPATLWLSGFDHLWFLQFLMLGAVLAYPFIRLVVRCQKLRWVMVAACVSTALAYGTWIRPYLQLQTATGWVLRADTSLQIAIRQSLSFATYIPVGVAFALSADAIRGLYQRWMFHALTIAALAAALTLQLSMALPAVSRLLYSTAVFVVLLRPWRPGLLAWLEPMARYSYLIYILHPLVTRGAAMLVTRAQLRPSGAALAAASLAVFAASGLIAASLRAIMPRDGVLPVVPVRMSGGRGAVPRP